MKYIIFNNRHPVIFSSSIKHSDVVVKGEFATSAGFVNIYQSEEYPEEITVKTFGESISLLLKSEEDDNEVIKYNLDIDN